MSYVDKLNIIDNVRSILSKLKDVKFYEEINKELPVFVILGPQSVGKSSVIKRITNNVVELPEAAGVCTKVATEIQLRKGDEHVEIVLRKPDGSEVDFTSEDIRKSVAKAQIEAIEDASSNYATKHTIIIKVASFAQPNITFIDMPGFTSNESKDEILKMAKDRVEKYPGTLILHVVRGDQDYDSVLGNDFIRDTDKNKITVLTHLDKYNEADYTRLDYIVKKSKNEIFAVLGNIESTQEEEEKKLKEYDCLKFRTDIEIGSKKLAQHIEKRLEEHLEIQIPKARHILQNTYNETIIRLEDIQEKAPIDILYKLYSELKQRFINKKHNINNKLRKILHNMTIQIKNFQVHCLGDTNSGAGTGAINDLDELFIGGPVWYSPAKEVSKYGISTHQNVKYTEACITKIDGDKITFLDKKLSVNSDSDSDSDSEFIDTDSELTKKKSDLRMKSYNIKDDIKRLLQDRGMRNIMFTDYQHIIELYAEQFSEYYTKKLTACADIIFKFISKEFTEIFTNNIPEIALVAINKLKRLFFDKFTEQNKEAKVAIDRIKEYNESPCVWTPNEHYLMGLVQGMLKDVDLAEDDGQIEKINIEVKAYIKVQRKIITEIGSKDLQKILFHKTEKIFDSILESSISKLVEFIKEPEKLIREREVLSNTKIVLERALDEIQKIDCDDSTDSEMSK
jgi:GTP-binding protein EngB required for normal cell division